MSKAITLDNIPVIKELVQNEIEGNTPPSMVSITYADLVAKVNAGELVPGQQYRITDYVTTTAQANTQSAGYAFDVIVTADSTKKLNENARAAFHEGAPHFNLCNLSAWKIKYDIKNDTTKYAWADNVNGKGVIYEMEDEHGNKCGYDFKNIMFARWKILATTSVVTDVVEKYGACKAYSNERVWGIDDSLFTIDTENIKYFYTFSYCTATASAATDWSATQGKAHYVSDNIIPRLYGPKTTTTTSTPAKAYLPNIVFINPISSKNIKNNIFGYKNADMTFLQSSSDNKFGSWCWNNLFGAATANLFGDGFTDNVLSRCDDNEFKNNCYTNYSQGNFSYNVLSARTQDTFFEGTWQYNNLVTMQNASEANGQPVKNKHVYLQFSGSPTISTADDGTITFGGDIINSSPVDKPVTVAYTLSADGEADITGTLSVTAAADSTTTFSGTETGVAGKTYSAAYVISYTLGENTIQIRM